MLRASDGHAVGVDALEVVARDRLVDAQQPEHPLVVLAEVRLALLVGPVVGHRRDREERLLALVERPRRREHRAAERAQEDRRPADLERLVGQADDVALAAERLDPGESPRGTSRAGRRPSGARRRPRRARRGRSRPRRRGAAGRRTRSATGRAPAGPSRRGPAAYSRSAAARMRSGVSASDRASCGASSAANRSRAETALALARGQDDVAEVRLERAPARPWQLAAAAVEPAPGPRRSAGSPARPRRLAERVVDRAR